METQEFGARLRELRIRACLTQRELADNVNVDFTYLSKIENGVLPPPSEKVILRLAEVLNADKDELITLAGRIPSDIAQILKNRKALQLLRSDRTQKKIRAPSEKSMAMAMPELPIPLKNFARVAIAIILVVAIGTSLWYASPTKALDITFPSLPSGTVGSTHSFSVKVDLNSAELVPIQSINMEIYNVSDTSKMATCTSLPLANGGTASYSNTDTGGGGTVSVTATSPGNNWGYFSGTGYAYWRGAGYSFGTNIYGYGYQTGAASITYSVTWTSPSTWPAGSYKVKVDIAARSSTLSETFTEYSSSFSLTRAAAVVQYGPSGGSGEEGPPSRPAGVTIISDIVDEEGVFTEPLTAESEDGKVELTVDEGTTAKTKQALPLSEISVIEMAEPPAPPADTDVIGLTYDLGPDNATFNPPITITFTYDEADIPEGVDEEDLVIAFWDKDADGWVVLEGVTVDPIANTISAPVSHFTAFTVLAPARPANFTATDLSITPAEIYLGESVSIKALITNIGDFAGSYEVSLKVNDMIAQTKEVTLDGGDSEAISFNVTPAIAGEHTVSINGLLGTVVVKAPEAPAAFTTSALIISPAKVNIGESVTISATITNVGDLTDTYKVTLTIDDAVVEEKEITLARGASREVVFHTAKDTPGTYTVNVNGLSGSFAVEEMPPMPPAPPPAPLEPPPVAPINWWLIGGIIAAVIIIGGVTWLVVARRRG